MEQPIYYHGTSDAVLPRGSFRLLPPSETGVISEAGRKVNLSRVFFTRDVGLARIYAGRACSRFGGRPVVYRVVTDARQVECLDDRAGASVYHAPAAFVEAL